MSLVALIKLWRFACIYGPGRTYFKVAGRMRLALPIWPWARRAPDVGVIGCGQFAFANIGYFVRNVFKRRVLVCYDLDSAARDSLARAQHAHHVTNSAAELLGTPGLRTVYIASNHATHAAYAAQALALGLDVYVEKPIAVTHAQLVVLLRAQRASSGRLFAGYNRPFSGAIRDLRRAMTIDAKCGFSIQCFVSGHQLAPGHWYRRPDEGTRVCGNIGHWLDLMIHLLAWRGMPDRLLIVMACADPSEPDDNLSIAITSDCGDVFSVMLTSRSEPFEGINESIHVQHGATICKIDDFRRMTLWQGARLVRYRYWPKDVGHRLAIGQPFEGAATRDWHEVELSTLLMLHITDMVRGGAVQSVFYLSHSWQRLQHDISSTL